MKAKIGILTLSDRASEGKYDDLSGAAIKEVLDGWITSEREYFYEVIPDEIELIKERLKHMIDVLGCDLGLTTGGTGPAPRDVTPEATEAVCEKMAIRECLEPVFPAIPYCIDLIGGAFIETDESVMKVFRPKQKKIS